MGVIQMNARCAKCATMRVWSAHAVGNPTDRDRSAEHAVAADRFAPEIVRFLTHFGRALAAAERQPVGRLGSVVDIPFLALVRRSRFGNARCAISVVPKPVVLAWFGRSWCCLPVVRGLIVCL